MAATLFLVAGASPKPTSSLPHNPFPSYLLEQNVLWSNKNYSGKAVTVSSVSFAQTQNLVLTLLMKSIVSPLTPMNSTSQSHKSYRFWNWPTSVLRLGFDIGGGTGIFMASLKVHNVTVIGFQMKMIEFVFLIVFSYEILTMKFSNYGIN